MAVTLGEIAGFLGCTLQGDAALAIEGVAPLAVAGPQHLSFLANPKYAKEVPLSKAGALLVSSKDLALAQGRSALVSENPYRDFARATARWFSHLSLPDLGVHPSAVVHPDAVLGQGVRIGAHAVVEAGARVGDGCVVFPLAYIGAKSSLGKDCLVYPSAVILERVELGDRVILHSGVVLGADGFGFAPDYPRGYVKVPQIGTVVIEDDVEIQANSCVDRGALGETRIGKGTKLDNLVQVAHNVVVGQHTVLVAQSGIAGSTHVGHWVTCAGQSAIAGHLTIGDGAVVTGQAGAGKDVPPKAMVSGSPAVPTLEHHRGLVELHKLPELKLKVKALEARLAELEARLSGENKP
jgi:UDP-3-O-[3-hydroxymyristoyl] glucosamine N-acyltransferase